MTPRSLYTIPLPGRPPLELGARTLVMGIINVTPDSFADGGVRFDPVGPSDAVDALGWHRSMSIASLLELTNDGLADYSMRRARNRYRQPVTLESKLGDPETTAWIAAMRAEAPSP